MKWKTGRFSSWPPKLKPLRNVRDERQWGSEENSRTLLDGVDVESVAWGYMVEMACSEKLEFGDLGEGNETNVMVGDDGIEIGLCERTRGSFRRMFGMCVGKLNEWAAMNSEYLMNRWVPLGFANIMTVEFRYNCDSENMLISAHSLDKSQSCQYLLLFS
jgi:hypothetical protein